MKKQQSSITTASVLLIMLAVTLISCAKEEVRSPLGNAGSPEPPKTSMSSIASNAIAVTHTIGERFGGGIVFHLTPNNHGLIADLTDLPRATWASNRKLIKTGASGTAIGEGKFNTNLIVAAQNPFFNHAALECDNSTRGGKTDWYLPSKDELNLLFRQRKVVGNFAVSGYWSSSEIDSANAWHQGFSLGLQGPGGKNAPINVRAIRSF